MPCHAVSPLFHAIIFAAITLLSPLLMLIFSPILLSFRHCIFDDASADCRRQPHFAAFGFDADCRRFRYLPCFFAIFFADIISICHYFRHAITPRADAAAYAGFAISPCPSLPLFFTSLTSTLRPIARRFGSGAPRSRLMRIADVMLGFLPSASVHGPPSVLHVAHLLRRRFFDARRSIFTGMATTARQRRHCP
jgi:hypothetical protein